MKKTIEELLLELIRQATTDRSHYYVKEVCVEAHDEITKLREENGYLKAKIAWTMSSPKADEFKNVKSELATMKTQNAASISYIQKLEGQLELLTEKVNELIHDQSYDDAMKSESFGSNE